MMNYRILIPCLLIGILSIAGIYSFIDNEKVETHEEIIIIHAEEKQDEITEEQNKSVDGIILDMSKEQCVSGITKCNASGCEEQC